MSKIGRMQWTSKRDVLKFVQGKPCAICGAPSSCAAREIGDGQYIVIVPVCEDHGLMAQGLGYLVAFPDPIMEYQMKPKEDSTQSVLKPCPFCGLPVELINVKTYPNGERSPAYIKCRKCNYHIAGYEDKDVINQWNTRSAGSEI